VKSFALQAQVAALNDAKKGIDESMDNVNRTRLRRVLHTLFLLIVILGSPLWSAAAQAQSNGAARLEIYLQDPNGVVMAGAKVHLEQRSLHLVRDGMTDKNGMVQFADLPAGDYVLTAGKDGFTDLVENDVKLGAGKNTKMNLQMQVSSANKAPQTGDQAPVLNTESSQPGQSVSVSKVGNLPAEARNIVDFSLSVPSNEEQQSTVGSSISEQQTTEQASAINANGRRVLSNDTLIDGTENNGQTSASVRHPLPLEAVSQYQVVTGQYMPEYGKAAGETTNIVTKSGSDQLKGMLYYFARNGDLDATPYCFNNPNGCARSDVFNEMGATLGGKLYKNKTYFFGSAEYTGENAFNPVIISASDLTLINTTLQGTAHPLVGSSVTSVSNNLLPTTVAQTVSTFRVDHTFNKSNILMARVMYAQANNVNPTSDCNRRLYSDGSNCGYTRVRASSYVGAYTHVFSPTLLNELHVQYTPQYITQNSKGTGPAVYILGQEEFGHNTFFPSNYNQSNYEVIDALTKTKGLHHFKFGVDLLRDRMYNYLPDRQQGLWEFNTISDFVTGNPYRLVQQFGNFSLQSDDTDTNYYAQDAWRLAPRLTLNYGLRYEVDFQPQGFNQTLNNQTLNGLTIPQGIPNSYANFTPRVGVAWALNKSGKTVLHAGYGIFYDKILPIVTRTLLTARQQLFMSDTSNPFSPSPPVLPTCELDNMYKNGVFPTPTTTSPDGLAYPATLPASVSTGCTGSYLPQPSVYVLNHGLRTPSVLQGSLYLDQQLSENWTLEVGYMNVAGVHRLKVTNVNLPAPIIVTTANNTGTAAYFQQLGRLAFPTVRLNPNYLNIFTYGSWGHQTYNSLNGSIIHRTSHNLTLRASWTWSHEIDDSSDFTSGQQPENTYEPGQEKADGLQDQRHRFVLSGVYHSPYVIKRATSNSPLRWVFGSWTASTSSIFSSGSPYNITIGHSASGVDGAAADRPYINGLNGLQGGSPVGRDAFRGARKQNVTLRLHKEIPFSSHNSRSLELSVDAFNLLNHPNFGTPYPYWGESATPNNPGNATLPLVWGRPMDMSSTCTECLNTFGAWTSAGAGRRINLGAELFF
jgi:hypothetical protein